MKNIIPYFLLIGGLCLMALLAWMYLNKDTSESIEEKVVKANNEGDLQESILLNNEQRLRELVIHCQKGCQRGLLGIFKKKKINQCKAQCAEDIQGGGIDFI